MREAMNLLRRSAAGSAMRYIRGRTEKARRSRQDIYAMRGRLLGYSTAGTVVKRNELVTGDPVHCWRAAVVFRRRQRC